ncbi:ankyrin repeat domain-containing protein [Yinghuangia soli]|uniref:HEAT repeat domain-containing protein n=1 Tax=Yinghuangia soli TaxID=2908204 RepID=A0AA41Q336_9ACTN|nr:ankyrin repeat domain-containing protein [Yinghuangia soli]MCF2530332.1 HEAT repeat domain-containing protein [Yinghuangia soli]
MESLVAAVRRADAEAVTALLREAGADPETVDEHGTPVLCLAVETFSLPVVDALLGSAAVQVDRAAPDGRTPLLRAIDHGAHDIVGRLINAGANLWLTDPEGRDALALTRYWCQVKFSAELNHRGGPGRASRTTVESESGNIVEEWTCGSATIRKSHTVILTELEPRYGIRPPFEELLARALAETNVDHEVWWATTSALQQRRDPAVWDEAAALRESADPRERYFAAEVLRIMNLFDDSDDDPYDAPLVDLFVPWVARERDDRVAWSLTAGLTDALDPRADEALPALTRHGAAKVRTWAVGGLRRAVESGHPEATAAVVACLEDDAPAVRRVACMSLGHAPAEPTGLTGRTGRTGRTGPPSASDLLASRLLDPDESVRVEAAGRLALRGDARGDEVLDGLGTIGEDSPYRWLLYDVFRYRYRAAQEAAGAPPGV